jgi:Domain of unknown function (DUF4167)
MRGRNRSNKGPNPLTRSYESNGPDVKIRGTAQHIADKYSQLARDAQASGDPVAAENYHQHAEHYYRIIATAQEQLREQFGYQPRFDDEGDEEGGFAPGERFGDESDIGSQPQPFDVRQDRQDRQEGERQPRFDRGDRPDRGDRRERFQRDRAPRQDVPRAEGERQDRPERIDRPERVDRPERADRSERGDRPERADRPERTDRPAEFRRDRRRFENEEPEGAGLPAFLTNPVRQAVPPGDEQAPGPVEDGLGGEANGDFRARRRRRRTRFGSEDSGNGNGDFSPEIETPAAE